MHPRRQGVRVARSTTASWPSSALAITNPESFRVYLGLVRPSVSPSAIEAEGDIAIEARQRVPGIRTWWLPVLRFLAGAGAGIGVAVLIASVVVYGFFHLARQ